MNKKQFYSAGYYKDLAPEPRFGEIIEIAHKLEGKPDRLLDVGCGDGAFTVLLKEATKAEEAFGIDIAEEAVTIAQERGIKAIQVDIDESPFPFSDAHFDMVYCGEIIEHLFNTDHLLQEVHRVLKPEGICVMTTPNLAGWPSRFALLLGYQPYPMAVSPSNEGVGKLFVKGSEGQWGHIRVFTLKALKELLKLHNFKIIQVKGSTATVASANLPLISIVDRLFSYVPSLSTRIIVILGKK